jgi:hypothetical protein
MPFQGVQYPSHWPELAQAAKAAASWRCAESGALHGSLAVSERNRLYRAALAACPLDHEPTNPPPRLAVYCQAGHLRDDVFQRWRSRRRHEGERLVEAVVGMHGKRPQGRDLSRGR